MQNTYRLDVLAVENHRVIVYSYSQNGGNSMYWILSDYFSFKNTLIRILDQVKRSPLYKRVLSFLFLCIFCIFTFDFDVLISIYIYIYVSTYMNECLSKQNKFHLRKSSWLSFSSFQTGTVTNTSCLVYIMRTTVNSINFYAHFFKFFKWKPHPSNLICLPYITWSI